MSIPLVQNNEKDSINTSIIAIKRQIERINALLGLSNSEEIDTSVFATKDELQQAITDLQPVDEVTLNNMQSVTSNAVAEALSHISQATDIKYYSDTEYGPSVTTTKWGLFIYGAWATKEYYVKTVGAGVTVSPTNSYWGDPASGVQKSMWGLYI